MKSEYKIKCDECKKTIKENVSFAESVRGGRCEKCKKKEKRLLVLLNTDNIISLSKLSREFLKNPITIIPKDIEVWEIDENNNMERRI